MRINWKAIIGGTAIVGAATLAVVETTKVVTPQVQLVINDTTTIQVQNVLGVSFPNLNSLSQVKGNSSLTNYLKDIHAGYLCWANGSISQWYAVRDSKGKVGTSYNCYSGGFGVADECSNGATWSTWKDCLFTADTMNANILYTANVNSVINNTVTALQFYSLLDTAKNDAAKNHTSIGIMQLSAEQKTISTSAQVVTAYTTIIPTIQSKFIGIPICADSYGNTTWDNAVVNVAGITANRVYYSVQDTPATYSALRTYAQGIGAATADRILKFPSKKVVWLQCAFKNSNPLISTNAHALFWLELFIDAGKYNVKNNNPITAVCEFNLKSLFDKNINPVSPYYAIREVSKVYGLTYESSSVSNTTGLVTFTGKDSNGNYTVIILNPNTTSVTLNSIQCNGKTVSVFNSTSYSGNLTDTNFTVANGTLVLPENSFSVFTFTQK